MMIQEWRACCPVYRSAMHVHVDLITSTATATAERDNPMNRSSCRAAVCRSGWVRLLTDQQRRTTDGCMDIQCQLAVQATRALVCAERASLYL